ncbi:transaldolase [Thermodesulfobium acidiphilum]|uniref:Transaldolase n=1 Tax=Thermodesulfobium acidiphilum TaxID=1794699 RepID=A0A2R4W115_THEAF|nr:fructose-6-phosphate aldolase [Thermodesulfobium acidiphilum]AWB10499.1 transaldolase [Thermodesulfobium acidiphilum]PMP85159.1 MAG: fructose-6-phosphate aldolase [Thermodesulfobium narugense]
MELYLDTAKIEEIEEGVELGIISGVTTNPSLLAKANPAAPIEHLKKICNIVNGPVSAEIISTNYRDMISEGLKISKISEKIVVKIPITEDGLKATKVLSKENIAVNMTLVFSESQAILASLVNAAYISPFIGRLDDISYNGMKLVKSISEILKATNSKSKIIAASIRHPLHVVQAAKAGAHIATVPFKTMKQLVKHPLTDIGIAKFLSDSKGISIVS